MLTGNAPGKERITTTEAFTRLSAHEELKKLIGLYWEELRSARGKGQPVAWCTATAHSELLAAMGFCLAFPENHAATCATRGVGTDLCIEFETRGFSPDLCSYFKVDYASACLGEKTRSPVGGLPRPDILIISTQQCNLVTKWYEELSRLFKVPILMLDVPHRHSKFGRAYDFQDCLDYLVEQLREQIRFIEEFTGRPFDYARFEECVNNTGRAGRLWTEIQAAGRQIPSPITCFDLFIHVFPLICMRGRPEAVAYYQLLKKEVDERAAKGMAAVGNERHRLLWDATPVWYRLRELGTRFANRKAAVVAMTPYSLDGIGSYDGREPLESLARGISDLYITMGLDARLGYMRNRIKDYSLDGLVLQWSRSCRPFFMGQLDILACVRDEMNVPSLVFEGDLCDSRLYSDAKVDASIDTFLDLLDSRSTI